MEISKRGIGLFVSFCLLCVSFFSLYSAFDLGGVGINRVVAQVAEAQGGGGGAKIQKLAGNQIGCYIFPEGGGFTQWPLIDSIDNYDIINFINRESFHGTGIGSNSVPVDELGTSPSESITVRADKAGAFGGSDGGGIRIYKDPTDSSFLWAQDVDASRGYEQGSCLYDVWGIKGGSPASPHAHPSPTPSNCSEGQTITWTNGSWECVNRARQVRLYNADVPFNVCNEIENEPSGEGILLSEPWGNFDKLEIAGYAFGLGSHSISVDDIPGARKSGHYIRAIGGGDGGGEVYIWGDRNSRYIHLASVANRNVKGCVHEIWGIKGESVPTRNANVTVGGSCVMPNKIVQSASFVNFAVGVRYTDHNYAGHIGRYNMVLNCYIIGNYCGNASVSTRGGIHITNHVYNSDGWCIENSESWVPPSPPSGGGGGGK